MNDTHGYFVFFHSQALEALGAPIKPYLLGDGDNQHILCREIDTGGAFIEMTLAGQTKDGTTVQVELMVPGSMVRMIVPSQSDGSFGFGPRIPAPPAPELPAAGPTAEPALAPPEAIPGGGAQPSAAPTPDTPEDDL